MVSQRGIRAGVTRDKIIEAAADEIHRAGFQAASIGDILSRLGISKGALYHHFKSKRELGFAVIDDCFGAKATAALDEALDRDDPIRGIADLFSAMAHKLEGQRLTCGCPINNLAQEMSPLDEGFRERLQQIYKSWHRRIANAIAGAQQRGVIRDEVEPSEVAYFVIATMQGATGLAKNAQDATIFRASIKGLLSHLESIRKAAA